MSLGFTEIVLIVLVVLLLFGAKRIPELARSIGKASAEFKKAKDGIISETNEMLDAAEKNAEVKAQQDNTEKQDKA